MDKYVLKSLYENLSVAQTPYFWQKNRFPRIPPTFPPPLEMAIYVPGNGADA